MLTTYALPLLAIVALAACATVLDEEFEAMLEGWVTDEAYWPKDRTFEMFCEWFEVQMSSIVQDLYLDEPLAFIG